MAFTLPAAINLHTADPDLDPLNLQNIGGSTRGTKSGGNLPITTNAAQCSNATPGVLQGTAFDLPVTVDSTTNTKILVWAFQFNAPNRIQIDSIGNDGAIFRLYSGGTAGNYRQFVIGGNDTPLASSQNGPIVLVMDPRATGFDAVTGTFDESAWSGYGLATKRLNLVGTSTTLWFTTRAFVFGTEKDAADIPKFTAIANFDDMITTVLGSDYTNKIHNFVSRAGSTYTILCPFQIGDGGVTGTTFTQSDSTILSPSDNDTSDPRIHISNQAMRTYCSTATLFISRCSFIWGTAADFDWADAVGVVSDCVMSGMGNFTLGPTLNYLGCNFQLAAGSACFVSGANLDDCIFEDIIVTATQDLSGNTVTGTTTLQAPTTMTDAELNDVIIDAPGTFDLSQTTVNGSVTVADNTGAVTIIKGSSSFTVNEGLNNTVTVDDAITINFISPEPGGALAIQNIDEFDVYLGEYVDEATAQADNPAPDVADYYRVNSGTYTRWDGSQWITGFAEATEVEIVATLLGGPGVATTQPVQLKGGANYRACLDLFGYFRNGIDFVATSGQDVVIPMTPNGAPDVSLLGSAAPLAMQVVASHPDPDGTIEVQVPDMSGVSPQVAVTVVEIAQLDMAAQRGAVSTGIFDLIEALPNQVQVRDDRTQLVPLATYPPQTPVQLPLNLTVVNYVSIDPTPYDANGNRVFFDNASKSVIEGASIQGDVSSNITKVLGVSITDANDIINPDSIS